MSRPLQGLLVVAIEQAVAAPFASRRLADAGARVIKIERPEGDFARAYDHIVHGESSHFVWLNRGKESVVADLAREPDRRLIEALLARADVLIQNLKPGALGKLGFGVERLRRDYPRLVCCSISGYGETGPYASRKAYDMLVQAESGLASVTGGPEEPSRVGASVVDVGTGMFAYEAILEALLGRAIHGAGADIRVAMFDAMMEWMTVPMLLTAHGRQPKRIGLSHPLIAPYGVFATADGTPILISIQNDREWAVLAERILGRRDLAADARTATNIARVENRAFVDGLVAAEFAARDADALSRDLASADIAFGRVTDLPGLLVHPHLRQIEVATPTGPVAMPAPPAIVAGATAQFGPVPTLGAHTDAVRREFLG